MPRKQTDTKSLSERTGCQFTIRRNHSGKCSTVFTQCIFVHQNAAKANHRCPNRTPNLAIKNQAKTKGSSQAARHMVSAKYTSTAFQILFVHFLDNGRNSNIRLSYCN